MKYLRRVLEDRAEDAMCRHESAEALGALGDEGSLDLLRERRDDGREEEVVRETCEIAVGRIEWQHSDEGRAEILRKRYIRHGLLRFQCKSTDMWLVTLLPSIRRRQLPKQLPHPPYPTLREDC